MAIDTQNIWADLNDQELLGLNNQGLRDSPRVELEGNTPYVDMPFSYECIAGLPKDHSDYGGSALTAVPYGYTVRLEADNIPSLIDEKQGTILPNNPTYQSLTDHIQPQIEEIIQYENTWDDWDIGDQLAKEGVPDAEHDQKIDEIIREVSPKTLEEIDFVLEKALPELQAKFPDLGITGLSLENIQTHGTECEPASVPEEPVMKAETPATPDPTHLASTMSAPGL